MLLNMSLVVTSYVSHKPVSDNLLKDIKKESCVYYCLEMVNKFSNS